MKTEYLVGGLALLVIAYLYATRTAVATPTYVNGVPVNNTSSDANAVAAAIAAIAGAAASVVHSVEGAQTPANHTNGTTVAANSSNTTTLPPIVVTA